MGQVGPPCDGISYCYHRLQRREFVVWRGAEVLYAEAFPGEGFSADFITQLLQV